MLSYNVFGLVALATTAFAQSSTASSASPVTSVITVGGSGGALTYTPSGLTGLPVGSKVQFLFEQANHTVIQTSFQKPCEAPNDSKSFYAGFVKTSNIGNETGTIYEIEITDTKPLWFYCGQATHCQKGMVGGINFDASGPNNLQAFSALATAAPTGSAVPKDNTPRGGSFIQTFSADIFQPTNIVLSPTLSSNSSTATTQITVIIQANVSILILGSDGSTTTSKTDISYLPSAIPGPGSQVVTIMQTSASGSASGSGSASEKTIWATPAASDEKPTTTMVLPTGKFATFADQGSASGSGVTVSSASTSSTGAAATNAVGRVGMLVGGVVLGGLVLV